MKKYVPEILITVLLVLLIAGMFLRNEGINSAAKYIGGAALFFCFIAAGEQFSKSLGRGAYFCYVSAACLFLFSCYLFLR